MVHSIVFVVVNSLSFMVRDMNKFENADLDGFSLCFFLDMPFITAWMLNTLLAQYLISINFVV